MPLTGTFVADFSSFQDACAQAQVSLKGFDSGASTVEASLNRMANSLDGTKIIQQATLMSEAVDRIGGVSQLTEQELARVGSTATEAAAKLTAMGQDVPPGIQAIADAANRVGESFSDWAGKFDLQKAISDPIGTAKDGLSAFAETLGPTGIALAAAGAAAAAIGTELYDLAADAATTGERVEAFGLTTGTAVEKVGAMAAGATIAGSSLDGFQQILVQVQRRMDTTGPSADKFNAALADLNINADAFRAADPSDRIAILAAGMQGAAGSTTLMSDALAIMGRAGVENIEPLMKYTADTQAAGEQLGYTWSETDTAAAKAFGVATASLSVELSTLSTTVGVKLLPIMTGAVTLTEDWLEFGLLPAKEAIAGVGAGLEVLAGVESQSAQAAERQNEGISASVVLFKAAAAQGLAYGAQVDLVATEMLKLGFSQDTVTKSTGLNSTEVKLLAVNLADAAKATVDYQTALDHVNDGLVTMKPSIDNESASWVAWVADMLAAGKSMADIITVSGGTKEQIDLVAQSVKDADTATAHNEQTLAKLADTMQKATDNQYKAFVKAEEDVNAAGVNWKATLDTADGATVEYGESLLKAGVSAQSVATYLGLAMPVVKAMQDDLKAQNAELATSQKETDDAAKGWADYSKAVVDATGTAFQKAEAAIDDWYAKDVAAHQKAGTDDAAYYAQSAALDLQKYAALKDNLVLYDKDSREYAQAEVDIATTKYQQMLDSDNSYTQAEIDNQAKVVAAAKLNAANFGTGAPGAGGPGSSGGSGGPGAVNPLTPDATGLYAAGTYATDAEKKAAIATQAAADAGGSFDVATLSVTPENKASLIARLQSIEQEYVNLPGRAPNGSGPTGLNADDAAGWNAMLLEQQDYLALKLALPGYLEGGPTGAGGLAMLHPNEFVVPQGGALVRGGGGATVIHNWYVNGTGEQVYQYVKNRLVQDAKWSRQFPAG